MSNPNITSIVPYREEGDKEIKISNWLNPIHSSGTAPQNKQLSSDFIDPLSTDTGISPRTGLKHG